MRRTDRSAQTRHLLILPPARLAACAGLIILSLLAAGCAATTAGATLVSPDASAVAGQPATATLPATVATTSTEPAPYSPAATAVPTPVALTLWLPAQMTAAAGEGAGVEAIAALNDEFTAQHPEIVLEVISKAQYGSGGMVDMLLATQAVVPDRLPDLAVVDVTELAQLWEADLLRSVDGLAGAAAVSLPPAIDEAISHSEQRFAVPFQADILILAFNTTRMAAAPSGWAEMMAAGHTLALPLRDGDGAAADAFWLHYAALGGTFDAASPELDTALAAAILQDYLDAVEAGVIPATALDTGSAQENWSWYAEGKADMCVVESSRYLADPRAARFSSHASVPTQADTPATMARCWVWVITASEPDSAELAGDYIDHAFGSQYLAQWLVAGHYLPLSTMAGPGETVREAYGQGYLDLAMPLLDKAFVYPDLRLYPQMQTIIGQMIASVLAGDVAPERAALSASAAIKSLR